MAPVPLFVLNLLLTGPSDAAEPVLLRLARLLIWFVTTAGAYGVPACASVQQQLHQFLYLLSAVVHSPQQRRGASVCARPLYNM